MNLTSNTPSNFIKAQVSSAAGMHAQSIRIRVISENVAHADSTSPGPGQHPYGRKVIFFVNKHDKKADVDVVQVQKISQGKSPRGKPHGILST